jgi:hypothetical protein
MPKLLLPQRTTFMDVYLIRYAKSLCLPTSGYPTLPWTLVHASAVTTAAATSFARVMAKFGFGRTLMTTSISTIRSPLSLAALAALDVAPPVPKVRSAKSGSISCGLPVRGYPFARRPLHPDAIACASGSGEPASASALFRNLGSLRHHKATCIIGEKDRERTAPTRAAGARRLSRRGKPGIRALRSGVRYARSVLVLRGL